MTTMLKHSVSIISLFLAITSYISVLGQTVSVVDSTTKRVLERVAVFNLKKTKSILSDRKGLVKIDDFSHEDTIVFRHTSYKTIQLTKSQLKELGYKLSLSKNVRTLKEFVLSTKKH